MKSQEEIQNRLQELEKYKERVNYLLINHSSDLNRHLFIDILNDLLNQEKQLLKNNY